MRIQGTPVLFILLLLVAACKHEPPLPPGVGQNPDGGGGGNGGGGGSGGSETPCDADTVYFEQDILPILQANCAVPGCHAPQSAEDGVILSNYNDIIETADVDPFDPDGSKLYRAITDDDADDRMPPEPASALPAELISTIRTWILQGAQNNSCQDNAPCDTANISYAQDIVPIISSRCQSCHSGPAASGGLDLTSFGILQTVALNGDLYSAVSQDGSVTPMPYLSNPIPQCEIDKIHAWVQAGAPQN